MLEIVGDEGVKLNKKQINELVELLDKEEALEVELDIIKSLKKSNNFESFQAEFEKRKADIKLRLEQEKRDAEMRTESEVKSAGSTLDSVKKEKAAVAVASNSHSAQPEISTTVTGHNVEEPKSPSKEPKDLR